MNQIPLKPRILILFSIFILATVALDRAVFGWALFQIPNELEWDTSPWYNFIRKTKIIHFTETEKGVLIAGSSVALYSALPQQIEATLKKNGHENSKIEFYSHVAMSPTDLHYYLDDLISKKPKMVLYILNPADFQLDYFREQDGNLVYSEKDRLVDYNERLPVKVIYPLPFFRDNFFSLNKNDLFALLTKSFLLINRYRIFYWDALDAIVDRHERKGRSYHNYTGNEPEEGIWLKGFVPQKFSIDCEIKSGVLRESIFIPVENTKLTVKQNGSLLNEFSFPKTGWYDIGIKPKGNSPAVKLVFESDKKVGSKTIDPKQYGKEFFYGIRLSQNFCKNKFEQNIAYERRKRLDDQRFADMSIAEYRNDYSERLYKDTGIRKETGRLNFVRSQKAMIAKYPFRPWSEVNFITEIRKRLTSFGIRFIIVNNPENPIELASYSNSNWYKALLNFLRTSESTGEESFYDAKDFLIDEKLFIDPHHLTYEGAEKMTGLYAKVIDVNLQK